MGTLVEWLGRAIEVSTSTSLTFGSKFRVFNVDATSAALTMSLPDATRVQRGGPIAYIFNRGAVNSFTLADNGGTSLGTIAIGHVAICLLINHTDADGDWDVSIMAASSASIPTVNDFFYTLGGVDTTTEAWEYEHVGNTWSQKTSSTRHHISAVAGTKDGSAYVAGSGSGGGQTGVEHDKYDPDTWTAKTDAPRKGEGRDGASDDDDLHVYGFATSPATFQDRYGIAADSWATGTAYPVDHRWGVAIRLAAGKIYIFGGDDAPFFSPAWVADQSNREHLTAGDTFSSKTGLPTSARALHGGFLLGSELFSVCGRTANSGSDLDRVDSYQLDTWTTRQAYTGGVTREGPGCATRSVGIAYATGGVSNIETHSYQVDTWTARLDHGKGGTSLRGFQNSSPSLLL